MMWVRDKYLLISFVFFFGKRGVWYRSNMQYIIAKKKNSSSVI